MSKRRATFNAEAVLEMLDNDEPMASGSNDEFEDLLLEVVTDDIKEPSKL